MRKIILLTFFTLSSVFAFAQTYNVKGVITDAITGEPLIGVSVILKNSSKGDVSDFDGNYKISNVPKGATLVFSYLGYKTKEVIANSEIVNAALEESAEKLDEIVVIGYGTQRKKEVTGAVSVVSSDMIENLKPTRIEQALQGQVAGVSITSSSGAPGAASNIRIRGISTNGNNNPLILVDGNRIEDLSVINPSDIESINVLKDATAGIYGVQAANGVILITTKSGRKNTDYKYVFNSYVGFQNTSRKIPLLNATEYALLANEAFAANGEDLPFSNISSFGYGTDWQDEVFKTAVVSNTDINITKGTEKTAFSFGASYLDQDGIVGLDKSNFNRFTAKLGVNSDILENLKLTSSVIYTNTNRKGLSENVLGSVLFNTLNFAPNLPVRDAEGNYTLTPADGFGQEVINPLSQVDNTFNKTVVHKIAPTLGLEYSFLDGFSAQAKMQYNYATVDSRGFNDIINYGVGSTVFDQTRSSLTNYKVAYEDYIFDAFVKYEKKFNEVHDVKVLLGTSVSRATFRNKTNIAGFNLVNGSLDSSFDEAGEIEDYNEINSAPSKVDGDRLLSYFTRLQYNYKGKYLFSGVLRRDGSSKFGPANKFGFFPSVSVGWVASEESFLEDSEIINFLKIRASYGVIGNDKIPAFGFVSLLEGQGQYIFDNEIITGTASGALSNPEIKWEKQKPLDIGFEMNLINKFDITFDYFYKKTEDLLLNPPVSGILGVTAPGASGPTVNAGTVENEGFEFSIGYKEKISEDFNFSVNYNITKLRNNVISVSGENNFVPGFTFGIGQDGSSRMEAGFPIGYFYGYKTDGIFQTQAEVNAHATQANANPGDIRFVDQPTVPVYGTVSNPDYDATDPNSNEFLISHYIPDGVITEEDKTDLGNPIPDVTMGINFSFEYKSFDFNLYAFASIGNDVVRNYERTVPLTNRTAYYLDRWTGPGTSNTFPRVTTGATSNILFSDFYVEDGSFVRLQNIQLGYTMNNEISKKVGLDKLRFYISANNLFTLTKYKGYDPSASNGNPLSSGVDQGFYPVPKTVLLGLNVNF